MIDNKPIYALGCALLLAIGLFVKEDVETKFFPVVGQVELVESNTTPDGQEVFVRFDKNRECEFLGLRMNDPLGYRVEFEFLDKNGDSYQSRPSGLNVAGPWLLKTNFKLEELRIEAIHLCPGLLGDRKVTSIMNKGK